MSLREIDDVYRGDQYTTPPTFRAFLSKKWKLNDFDPCPLNTRPNFNGLNVPWPAEGFTFANVPYSNPEPWVDKARSEKDYENHDSILLMRTDNSTVWFEKAVLGGMVHLIKGRLKFKPGKPADFASMIVVYDHSKPFECGISPYLLNPRGQNL